MPTTKERLLELHKRFHGSVLLENETELSLVVDLLETLIEKAEELEFLS